MRRRSTDDAMVAADDLRTELQQPLEQHQAAEGILQRSAALPAGVYSNASNAPRLPLRGLEGQMDVYLMETGNARVSKVVCANIATVGGIVHTCCEAPEKGAPSLSAGRGVCCLPSIIVGGTQKSGSTALSAVFLQHPNVRFADRKEVHFFSMPKAFSRGLDEYMAHFSIHNMPGREQNLDRFVTVEATPYYLHSADACRFISYTMPSAKIIFLLRDPTDRSYSEYNMKLRRIEEGRDLVRKLQENRGKLVSCMLRFALVSTAELVACLPASITEAAKWKGNAKRVLQRLGVISRRRGVKQIAKREPDSDPDNEAGVDPPPALTFAPDEKPKLDNLAQMMTKCVGKGNGDRFTEAEIKSFIRRPGAEPARPAASARRALGAEEKGSHPTKRWLSANESLDLRRGSFAGALSKRNLDSQSPAKQHYRVRPAYVVGGRGAVGPQYTNASSDGVSAHGGHGGRKLQKAFGPVRKAPVGAAKVQSNFVGGNGFVPELGVNITLGTVCIAFLEEKVQRIDDSFRTEMENIRRCEETT